MLRIFLSLCLLICMYASKSQPHNFIPQPVSVTFANGGFVIDKTTSVQYNTANAGLKSLADYFSTYINEISGENLRHNRKTGKYIQLRLSDNAELGEEGYSLMVRPTGIILTANNRKGLFYAMQTLFQTLPAIRTNQVLTIPSLDIIDYPRFEWRGMHLDVSRHFFSIDLVKKYLDLMAAYKMNTLHWHLTDDPGWRLEIKSFPKLTDISAWRVNQNHIEWTDRPQAKPGEAATYGGYYTQEQIKEVVRYATARNITIVPEIDVPGHTGSVIAAYPQFSCAQQPQLPMTGGNYKGMTTSLCAGNDSVYLFLEKVYGELMDLFPGTYIHMGGDEVDKSPWQKCAKCQRKMKEENLKSVDELQSYFVKRMEKIILARKRKMLGWDEILEGGLAASATVMSWRGEAGGIEAARMGHDVVMTPGNPLYFDKYQADPATELLAIGGFNTLKKVYAYEPIPKQLSESEAKYVKGAQANIWAEYISTPSHLLYMAMPRMLALSEVVWSTKKARNWDSFLTRMQYYYPRFDQLMIPHSKGNYQVEITPHSQGGQLTVTLETEVYNGDVYYTLDGSTPDTSAQLYTGPVKIDSSRTIKAITVVNGKNKSTTVAAQEFVMHKAIGRDVTYTYPISTHYTADGPNSLTDGVRGTNAVGQYWHGISGQNMIATISFDTATKVETISIGCLQNFVDWIMLPKWVKFEVSDDGKQFREVAIVNNPVSVEERTSSIHEFTGSFAPQTVKAIRVTVQALDKLPESHPGAGLPAWIFADEIVVK